MKQMSYLDLAYLNTHHAHNSVHTYKQELFLLLLPSHRESPLKYCKDQEISNPSPLKVMGWILFSPLSLSFLIHFLMLFPFIIYLSSIASSPSISTLPPPLLFRHLLPFTSEEGGGRNLLSCDLHCLGHFLINAANKIIVFQLMRMQQATPGLRLPYFPLSSTPFWSRLALRMPLSTIIRFFPSSSGFFPWACGL